MQIKAFCQDVWIWQRRQIKAIIICILIFISSVIQRFLRCPWFNSLHYVVGQKNKHYLESKYPFRPRATGLLRLMDITDHIKPRCKREGKKQTGETLLLQFTIVYFWQKLHSLKIIKHTLKKWKYLWITKASSYAQFGFILTFGLCDLLMGKRTLVYILATNYAQTSTEMLFPSSKNISLNTLKTWPDLRQKNGLSPDKKAMFRALLLNTYHFLDPSGSISSKEFGFRERSDGHVCFQSREQLQD